MPNEINARLSMVPRASLSLGGEQQQRRESAAAEEDDEDREPPPREPQPPHLPSPTQQDHLVAQLKDEIQVSYPYSKLFKKKFDNKHIHTKIGR